MAQQKAKITRGPAKEPDLKPTLDWIGKIFDERLEMMKKPSGRLDRDRLTRLAASMLLDDLYIKSNGKYTPCWPLDTPEKEKNRYIREEREIKAAAMILASLDHITLTKNKTET